MQTAQSRMDTVGASEVSALFDENPYESRYSLLCKKTGVTPPEDFNEHTTRQQVGLDLERPILEIWAKRENLDGLRHNTESKRAESLPGLSATPDAIFYDDRWLEAGPYATADAKTVRPHERKKWLDGIPRHHYWQQQQQMMIVGVPRGYLVALFGVDEIAATEILANYDDQIRIVQAAGVFWRQARGELPWPSPDSHRATLEALMHRERERERVTVDFGDERIAERMQAMDDEYQAGRAALRAARKRDQAAKSALLNALGSADCGTFSNGSGYRVQRIGGKKPHNRLVRFTGDNTEEGGEDE